MLRFFQYSFGSDVCKYMHFNQSVIIDLWQLIACFNLFFYDLSSYKSYLIKKIPLYICIIVLLFKILNCRFTFFCWPWFLESLGIFIIWIQFLLTKNFFWTLYVQVHEYYQFPLQYYQYYLKIHVQLYIYNSYPPSYRGDLFSTYNIMIRTFMSAHNCQLKT